MRLQENQEVKVTIGCRVSQEVKDRLYSQAREQGYQSFSQYLEHMILQASDELNISEPLPSNKLSDDDLENLQHTLRQVLAEQQDLENEYTKQLNDLEQDIDKLLPIAVSEDQKELLTDYLDHLVDFHNYPNRAAALIGALTKALKDGEGGLFSDEFPGRTEFLGQFTNM